MTRSVFHSSTRSLRLRETLRRLRNRDQILGDGALVAHAIIKVGEPKAIDLGNVEMVFQILQAAVKRGYVDNVPLSDQMCQHFFGSGGVSRAFAVHAIKNVGHEIAGEYTAPGQPIAAWSASAA